MQKTDPIAVKTICGPASTTIVPPHQAMLEGVNQDGTTMQISGSFTSTNDNCPITEHVMTDDASGAFQLTENDADGFTVERIAAITEDDEQEDLERFFTIQAQALGGASGSETYLMHVADTPGITTAEVFVIILAILLFLTIVACVMMRIMKERLDEAIKSTDNAPGFIAAGEKDQSDNSEKRSDMHNSITSQLELIDRAQGSQLGVNSNQSQDPTIDEEMINKQKSPDLEQSGGLENLIPEVDAAGVTPDAMDVQKEPEKSKFDEGQASVQQPLENAKLSHTLNSGRLTDRKNIGRQSSKKISVKGKR